MGLGSPVARQGQDHPAAAPGERHRSRRRRDDGEPILRPPYSSAGCPERTACRAGSSTRTPRAAPSRPTPWRPTFGAAAIPVPDHSYEGGRVEYNGGACDGWMRAGDNDALRDRLLPPGGRLALPGPGGGGLDRLQPLLRVDHGADPAQPPLSALRRHGPAGQHARPVGAAHDLGTGWPTRASAARYYRATFPSSRSGARSTPTSRNLYQQFLRGLRFGGPAGGGLRRPALRGAGVRGVLGRPPARRHPRRRKLAEQDLRGDRRREGLEAHGARRQLRPVGRVLRACAADRGARRGPRLRSARLPRAVPGRLAVCAAQASSRRASTTTRRFSG